MKTQNSGTLLLAVDDRDAAAAYARISHVARCVARTNAEDLRATLRLRDGRPTVIIMSGTDDDGLLSIRRIESLRMEYPLVPIIIYLARSRIGAGALSALARAGADRFLIDNGTSSDGVLPDSVTSHFTHSLLPRLPLSKYPSHCSRAFTIATWIVRQAYEPLHASDVAAHFGVDRKTIYRILRAAGWVSVEQAIALARLIHAASLLEGTALAVPAVARRLRFPTADALRKHIARATGLTTSALSARGPLTVAVELWLEKDATHSKVPSPL